MFLNVLKRRNPELIQTAVQLHQENKIPSNCYLLDLDTIGRNAGIISGEAEKNKMKVFAMTKQIGREPAAIKKLIKCGITHFVTVDIQGARAVVAAGGKLGHVGHLVQIGKAEIPWMIEQKPEYWTVFTLEQAEAISRVLKDGEKQKVLARIQSPGDTFYRGHEGGFPSEKILDTAEKLDSMKGIEFAGITSFPCLLFDNDKKCVYSTPNQKTLVKAAEILKAAQWDNPEINTPGTTSSRVLSFFKNGGSTQVEPGHGLTGTTPLHGVQDLPEKPAVLYVSEISHFHENQAYCYGGGLYVDPVFPPYPMECLTGSDKKTVLNRISPIEFPADNAIDYYGMLFPPASLDVSAGDTVVMGFRPQIFVTRAYVASVSGIHSGNPKVESISYADGRSVQWP